MLLTLGFIAGLLFATFVLVVMIYFKRPIETKTQIIEKHIGVKGPGAGKGYLFEAQTDAEVARQAIIDRNTAAGRDTKLSELQ
mgnify:CR=1 FL=1